MIFKKILLPLSSPQSVGPLKKKPARTTGYLSRQELRRIVAEMVG